VAALHDPAVLQVEAGDDPFREHHCTGMGNAPL
jgi:hypothetical protein